MPPDMESHVNKYLVDILDAIKHIDLFVAEVKSFSDYEKNLLVKRAVERELEIIGEAMSKLLQLNVTISISNARRMVDLRNRVIHGYDKVDDGVIWGILKRHLPKLKEEVTTLLSF